MTSKDEINKLKYKKELDLINKYINNDIIHDIILKYESNVDGKIIKLRANINVQEMVFLGKLIDLYNCKNVLEIGCANGVSGMVITNQICLNGGGSLISIDPFQTPQWQDVGKYNINKVVDEFKKKNIISQHEVIQEFSSIVLKKYVKTSRLFDCIFIDGSHDFIDVVVDIFCSIKILKKGGIMILDDVLHDGVKLVVDELINFKNLKKIHINELDDKLSIVDSNYKYIPHEKSYTNPITMYAYVKI